MKIGLKKNPIKMGVVIAMKNNILFILFIRKLNYSIFNKFICLQKSYFNNSFIYQKENNKKFNAFIKSGW